MHLTCPSPPTPDPPSSSSASAEQWAWLFMWRIYVGKRLDFELITHNAHLAKNKKVFTTIRAVWQIVANNVHIFHRKIAISTHLSPCSNVRDNPERERERKVREFIAQFLTAWRVGVVAQIYSAHVWKHKNIYVQWHFATIIMAPDVVAAVKHLAQGQ